MGLKITDFRKLGPKLYIEFSLLIKLCGLPYRSVNVGFDASDPTTCAGYRQSVALGLALAQRSILHTHDVVRVLSIAGVTQRTAAGIADATLVSLPPSSVS